MEYNPNGSLCSTIRLSFASNTQCATDCEKTRKDEEHKLNIADIKKISIVLSSVV